MITNPDEPSTSRIALIPIYVSVIAVATVAVAAGWLPWPLVPVASLVIGAAFGVLAFVAHEALHGGIVELAQYRGDRVIRFVVSASGGTRTSPRRCQTIMSRVALQSSR